MMHQSWSSIEDVPNCFSRSFVKFQGHIGPKNVDFDPNWAFPDCNSSLNSPMASKWSTQLYVVYERVPIAFQGHLSNFKIKWGKESPILTRIVRFRTVTDSFEIMYKAWRSTEDVPYCFRSHPCNFQVKRAEKSTIWIQFQVRLIARSQLSNPWNLSYLA